MVNKPLDMRLVYKRDRSLGKAKSIKESSIINEDFIDLDNVKSNSLYKMKVDKYLENCLSYKGAINLLEQLYKDDKFDLLENATIRTINYIIPCVDKNDIHDCIETIKESNVGDMNKDRLIEAAKNYKSIDRIKKNHINLSKRFSLESFSNKAKSNKSKCYTICEAVDTYKLSPFIKMNIALEEIAYLSYLEGGIISPESMVENVSTYFLLRDSNTKEDIDEYKRAIKESKVLPMGSDSKVLYFTESQQLDESSYWKDKMQLWIQDPNKSINGMVNIIKENFNDITALKELTSTLDDYISINELDTDSISNIIESISELTGKEAKNIINIISENKIDNSSDFINSLSLVLEAAINDEVYADGTDEPKSFSCEDIDSFKMHNIITDAQEVGEFLDQMEKTSAKESPLKIEKIDGIEDINRIGESVSDYIDSHNHISVKLGTYIYDGSITDINNYLESNINCINNILYNRDCRSYYILGENSFDIYLRTKYYVDNDSSQRGFTLSEKKNICDLVNYANAIESLNETALPAIVDKLNDRYYAATVSAEEAALVCEVLAPYDNLGEGFIDDFVELCQEEYNPGTDYIKYLCNEVKVEPFNIYEDHNMRLNFCAYDIMHLNEDMVERASNNIKAAVSDLNPVNKFSKIKATVKPESPESKSDKVVKSEDKDTEKKEVPQKKPLSLNDVKLAWKGVKSKIKGANAKQKEMCRDLDMEFNNLCRTIESTYGVDHREEIITGQVNKSLSKIIKIGISLIGLGAISKVAFSLSLASALVIPAITAVAMFARSSFTTRKEKKMILDEIDIELQVLEREISRAESSGSTKKYRALLTIQKNLQRRRQEIYYGLAKHGSKIPMQSIQGLRRD